LPSSRSSETLGFGPWTDFSGSEGRTTFTNSKEGEQLSQVECCPVPGGFGHCGYNGNEQATNKLKQQHQ
jgi:hypothetical protein